MTLSILILQHQTRRHHVSPNVGIHLKNYVASKHNHDIVNKLRSENLKTDCENLLSSTEERFFFVQQDVLVPRTNTKNYLYSTSMTAYLCSIMVLILNTITKRRARVIC
jgi:hypothetical protein